MKPFQQKSKLLILDKHLFNLLLNHLQDVPKRQITQLDPEDTRNLSDPGWKHPNWKGKFTYILVIPYCTHKECASAFGVL